MCLIKLPEFGQKLGPTQKQAGHHGPIGGLYAGRGRKSKRNPEGMFDTLDNLGVKGSLPRSMEWEGVSHEGWKTTLPLFFMDGRY
ncbi:hypothetical protein AMTR_s00065p00067020 [Amborella trichopoda]|uniref:Uncharacterized protein n=1 Tax=Amborella trichopoda TaxID=13333 RepID=U5D8K8_AMBTC|nr:hypothetical protein AMTR_s00065p00067020 [Amborella trichopoda]